MTSTRPYLIRAFYEWIVDNDLTPHLLVNAGHEHVSVPQQHVENGKIVLNISPSAVQGLDLGNDWIGFNARFGGKSEHIGLPPGAVSGIYARENGQGMLFQEEPPESDPPHPPDADDSAKNSTRPNLKIIK
ncbi:MAG: ClpXP protease specificity-enhancing factor [Pseudomonadota bacterium]